MREYLFVCHFTQKSCKIYDPYSLIQQANPVINTIEFLILEKKSIEMFWNPPYILRNMKYIYKKIL